MDPLSFAEIRGRFHGKEVMGLRSPRSPVAKGSAPPDPSNSSSENAATPPSLPCATNIAPMLPQGEDNFKYNKKPPVTLSVSASLNRYEDAYVTTPVDSSRRSLVFPDDNAASIRRNSSTPSLDLSQPSQNQALTETKRASASLSLSATAREPRESTQSDSLLVSLADTLSAQCQFFQLDTVNGEYQRRDAQTIIYLKQKPPMPTLTTSEINHLQRYSST